MKTVFLVFISIIFINSSIAQSLYFPPQTTNHWDTVGLESLGWCSDQLPALYSFLENSNSKAFIVLKDGKIVIEKYFDTFTQDSLWYWASAGKTLTAFMVGKAQEDGYLSITDTTSSYLGQGWTSLTTAQEEKITIRDQLSMVTGLDESAPDVDCTLPSCLTYLTDPGTRWSYHNAPYTLLQDVVAAASGLNFNLYMNPSLKTPIGMDGFFVPVGSYNSVYFSKPRSMARFGLLMLGNGNWDGIQVMNNVNYLNDMISPSQTLNNAYGYLWWLNGSANYMLPQTQFVFQGSAIPNAPADAYAAMGKNGQILNVSPSENLVVVRMGNNPDNSLVPTLYCDTIWQKLNAVICTTNSVEEKIKPFINLYPNPATDKVFLNSSESIKNVQVINLNGSILSRFSYPTDNTISINAIPAGLYILAIETESGNQFKKLVIE